MENGEIADYQISASEYRKIAQYVQPPYNARLNRINFEGDEMPRWADPAPGTNNWIAVDLFTKHNITKVLIQGSSTGNDYITTFTLSFSQDGYIWHDYRNSSGTIAVRLAYMKYANSYISI